MSCRHDLALTRCKVCYPETGDIEPEGDGDSMDGPGAVGRDGVRLPAPNPLDTEELPFSDSDVKVIFGNAEVFTLRIIVEPDGNVFCAHFEDFVDLQVSECEFGKSPLWAAQLLLRNRAQQAADRLKGSK